MEDRAELYALHCPDSGEIRYIGKAVDSAKRFKAHLRDARRRSTPVYCWMRSLFDQGKAPHLSVLATSWEWPDTERKLIAQYRADGARLLNVADGGDEPQCSTEQRAANGRKNAQAIHNNPRRRRLWEIRHRLGIALKKGQINEATKAKMRDAARRNPAFFGQWANI
jgi:hypothetical protein